MPLPAEFGEGLRGGLSGMIIVNDVAGADEEIRAQGGHGGEGGVTEFFVFIRGGDRAATVGLAVHEGVVIHAATHAKAEDSFFREGLEAADGSFLSGLTGLAIDEAVVVLRARFELAEHRSDDEIVFSLGPVPFAAGRLGEVGGFTPLEISDALFSGHISCGIEPGSGGETGLEQDASLGDLPRHLALRMKNLRVGWRS